MIEKAWFARHPVQVAFDLIGATLTVARDGEQMSGRITETEAYAGPEDHASHAGRLRTGRAALFGEVGRLYIYRSYGIHTMLNIVAHSDSDAGAVLIRAVEPLAGLDRMSRRRRTLDPRKLTVGPGVLCQAFGLRFDDDGYDLTTGRDICLERRVQAATVVAGPRIGITRAVDRRWRFFDGESRFVSVHRRGEVVTRDMLEGVIDNVSPRSSVH